MAVMTTLLSLINSPLGPCSRSSITGGSAPRRSSIRRFSCWATGLGHHLAARTAGLRSAAYVCRHLRLLQPQPFPGHPLLSRFLSLLLPRQRPMDNMPIGWYPQEDEWGWPTRASPRPYLKIMFPHQPPRYNEYLDLRGRAPAELERWKRRLLVVPQGLTLAQPAADRIENAAAHRPGANPVVDVPPGPLRARGSRSVVIFPSTVHTWQQMYKFEAMQAPLQRRKRICIGHVCPHVPGVRRRPEPGARRPVLRSAFRGTDPRHARPDGADLRSIGPGRI